MAESDAPVRDAITDSILAGRLGSVTADMATILGNTARSPRISVQREFGCALLNRAGEVVATDNPRHLASLQAATRKCLDDFVFDLDAEDVLFTNDPYGGSPTVQFFTLVKPVAVGQDIIGYVAAEARMSDIGGMVLGNTDPTAREVRAEGVLFTPMRIERYGRPRRDIIDTLVFNSRLPEIFAGDLDAMLGAVRVGARSLARLLDRYGSPYVTRAMDSSVEYAQRRMSNALRRLPEGTYRGEASLEHDGHGGEHLTVRVTLSRSGDRTLLDFTGTDGQSPGFVNCSEPLTRISALLPLLGLIEDSVPYNDGLLRALEFRLPPGTLVSPRRPAPTSWSTEHMAREVGEATRQALAAALPDAVGQGLPSRDLVMTVHKEKRVGATIEQLAVTDLAVLARPGAGASAGTDGWGLPGTGALGQAPSIEEFEREFGVDIRKLEFEPDSAGAGESSGGHSVVVVVGLPEQSGEHLYCLPVTSAGGPAGVLGGLAGSGGRVTLISADGSREVVGSRTVDRSVQGLAALEIRAAGGAGFGDPRDRRPESVRAEVADGLLSPEAARSRYHLGDLAGNETEGFDQ